MQHWEDLKLPWETVLLFLENWAVAVSGSENQDECKNFEQRNLTSVLGMCNKEIICHSSYEAVSCGYVAPRSGSQSRFALKDTMLQAHAGTLFSVPVLSPCSSHICFEFTFLSWPDLVNLTYQCLD